MIAKQDSPTTAQDEQNTNGSASQLDNVETLVDVLVAHSGERHAIVLHDFPDPDAISAAYAHQLISQRFGIETAVFYNGRISHQQNIALVRLLGVELTRFTAGLDFSQFDYAIYLDNQGTSAIEIVKAMEAAGVEPLIIVDHHELQERLTPRFSDIRRAGSTATIYAHYIKKGALELNRAKQTHVLAATALMHGIITDTNNLLQANQEDFQAAAFLSGIRDSEMLRKIMSQSRSRQVMRIIRKALGDRVTVESYSIAGIGYLRADDRDAIPQAADFLLTEENVHTAIVYGIVRSNSGAESLIGSLRTLRITIDPDDFIKTTFGQDQDGAFYGGGKELAGGFEVPLGFLAGEGDDAYLEMKWQVFDQQIKQKIFAKIGVKSEA